jgi:F-box interacting protein
MLCFTINYSSVLLWNPFINKFKLLPHLKYVPKRIAFPLFSFGYDPFVDNYKVFAVFFCKHKNQVFVHTLGMDSWRSIHNNFPRCSSIRGSGIFVGGTVNWLAADSAKTIWLPIGGGAANSFHYIVSLDLKNESLQTLLQPDLGTNEWILGVVRDCLSIFANTKMCFDVWIMKEYGMKESWTKLYSVPYMKDEGLYFYNKVLYISEEGKLLMFSHVSGEVILKLVVYDSKNGTFKITEIENIHDSIDPQVYVESLISPCS